LVEKRRFTLAIRRSSAGEKVFDVFNYIFMFILCLTTIYPFLYLFSNSLASSEFAQTQITIIPKSITFENYKRVLTNPLISSGYYNTILRTAIGTFLGLVTTFALAYPLSKKYFPNRNFWTGIIVFTMFFGGGMIPTYILVRNLNLMNTIWALILPELVSAYNFIIVRNYMMSLPESIEESARIDGANDIIILIRIVLPVCKPILATVALWIAVWHWNSWFDSMIYSQKAEKQVVQLIMRRIVLEGSQQVMNMSTMDESGLRVVTPESLKAATVMVTTIPILLVYPFIQKYFVKGVMLGSLKG